MNHINAKVLLGLGVAAVVAIGAALLLSSSRQPISESREANVYALPGLRGHLNEVKSIQIVAAGEQPVATLLNQDTGWVVQEKTNYPANLAKLRELLLSLAELRLLEPKTSSEQRYTALAIEDLKNKDAKGVLVRLEGLPKPVQLIVGNNNANGEGVFIRLAEDKQSWLASGKINADRDPARWLDNTLLDYAAEKIAEIVVEKADGSKLRLFKPQAADSKFQIADLPAGRELLDPAVNGLTSTLTVLRLEDVNPSQQPAADSALLKAHFRLFNGIVINVTAWRQDNKHFARLDAQLDQTQAEATLQSELNKAQTEFAAQQNSSAGQAKKDASAADKPQAPLAVSDPGKFQQQRLDELSKEVAALNQRLQAWNFVIPAYKYANLDKSAHDLLKPQLDTKPTAVQPAGKTH